MRGTLTLTGVSKRFGSQTVLDDVHVRVEAAEIVGLVGVNGAGKTTLLRIAAGLVIPDGGAVAWSEGPASIRYFAGERTLSPHVRGRRWAALFGVRVDDRRRLGRLSRGNRQFLGLRVVLGAPGAGLILLDEPWEGLDPAGSDWLLSMLTRWREWGAAILVSSHRLHDLAAVCTRFVLLRDGRCLVVSQADWRPGADRLAHTIAGGRE